MSQMNRCVREEKKRDCLSVRINLAMGWLLCLFYVFPALKILKNRTNLATKKLMIKYQRFLAVGRLEIKIRQSSTRTIVLNVQRIFLRLFKCR